MIEFGDLRLYTVEDLAEKLGVHIDTVREMLRKGTLRGKKLAKRWYVPEQSLEAYFLSEKPKEALALKRSPLSAAEEESEEEAS